MSKERYTVRTEGSRTVVHWERKAGKVEVRAATTGRFVAQDIKSTQSEIDPAKS
jgi:ribosomal protein L34E